MGYTYGYNPAGQITSQTRTNDLYAWTGGANGTTTYQPDGLNRIDVNSVDLPYDAKGNLLGDLSRTYAYDNANRLTSGGVSGGATNTLTYDPLSRLYATTGTAGGTYVYDGAQIAGVAFSGGALNNRFVFGPWPDEMVLAIPTSTNAPRWYLQDHQASTVAITDDSGAALYTLTCYQCASPTAGSESAFGEAMATRGGPVQNLLDATPHPAGGLGLLAPDRVKHLVMWLRSTSPTARSPMTG